MRFSSEKHTRTALRLGLILPALALLTLSRPAVANYDPFYSMTVNSVTYGDHRHPALASNAHGITAVAWADDSDGNGVFQIRMRIFGTDGRELIVERSVHRNADSNQIFPRIAMNGAGRIVVAWLESRVSDQQTYAIRARGYRLDRDSDGNAVLTDVFADTELAPPQPLVSADVGLGLDVELSEQDDFFVVAWTPAAGSSLVRFFDAKTAVALEACGSMAAGCPGCRMANVGIRPADGMVLVAFEGPTGLGLSWCDPNEAPLEENTYVSLGVRGRHPDVKTGLGGRTFIAWENPTADAIWALSLTGIAGRVIQDQVGPLRVEAVSRGSVQKPRVAVLDTNHAVVVWEGDPDGTGSYEAHAKTISRTGAVSCRFTLNPVADGDQLRPQVAVLEGDDLDTDEIVVVWEDDNNIVRRVGQTGARYNIMRRVLDRTTRKPPARSSFSIVLLPDTQFYTHWKDKEFCPIGGCRWSTKEIFPDLYDAQIEWILNHREEANLVAALHLGDMTARNQPEQWEIARKAHNRLDQARFPNTSMLGNHDYPSTNVRGYDGDSNDVITYLVRDSRWFNYKKSTSSFDFATDNFHPARYAWMNRRGSPYSYTSIRNDRNDVSHVQFDAGGYRFSVISLEFAPTKDALCWAGREIERNPNNKVILVTHCHLTRNGGGTCGSKYNVVGASRVEDLDNELAGRYKNVFLVLNGHAAGARHETQTTPHPYTKLLVDYQFEPLFVSRDTPYAKEPAGRHSIYPGRYWHVGNGWLQTLEFVPDRDEAGKMTVEVRSHSVADGDPRFFADSNGRAKFYAPDYPNAVASDPEAFPHRRRFTVNLAEATYEKYTHFTTFRDRTVASTFEDFDAGLPEPKTCGNGPCPRVVKSPSMSGNGESFVVVWEDDVDADGSTEIRGRMFDKYGCETKSAFRINANASGSQKNPSVSMAPDGRFVVAWEETAGGKARIEARVFNAAGTPISGDILVAEAGSANGSVGAPSVALAQARSNRYAGYFVVAWDDDRDGDGAFDVYARSFKPWGAPHAGAFNVHADLSNRDQRSPSVALSGNGIVAVAYVDAHTSDVPTTSVRVFQPLDTSRSSNPALLRELRDLGGSSRVAGARRPSLALNDDGTLVVAWVESSQLRKAVLSNVLDRDARPVITDCGDVGVSTSDTLTLSVGLGADGSHVVVWPAEVEGKSEIHALWNHSSSPVVVNTFWAYTGRNDQASSYMDPEGNLFVAWRARLHPVAGFHSGHDEILLRGMTPP